MSGPADQQLTPIDVPPGALIYVSVKLRTPEEEGTYRGYWGLENAQGLQVGIGSAGQLF